MNSRMPGVYDMQQQFVPGMPANAAAYHTATTGYPSQGYDANNPNRMLMQVPGNQMYYPVGPHPVGAVPMFQPPHLIPGFQQPPGQHQPRPGGVQAARPDGHQARVSAEEAHRLQYQNEQKMKFKQQTKQSSGGVGSKIDVEVYAKKMIGSMQMQIPNPKPHPTPPSSAAAAAPHSVVQPQPQRSDEDGFGDFLSYPARGVEHSMPAGSVPHPQISVPINAGQGHPIAPVAAAVVPLTNVTAHAAKKPVDVDSMMMKYSDLGLTDKQSSKTTQQQQHHHQHRENMVSGNVVPHHPIVQPPMPHQFGRLPQWLNADALLPDLYHGVANMCCRPDGLVDTNLVYPILVQSNLPREVLRHLWTLCNLTFPGQLTRIELYVLLALIGIAQAGAPVLTVEALSKLPAAPVPQLGTALLPLQQLAPLNHAPVGGMDALVTAGGVQVNGTRSGAGPAIDNSHLMHGPPVLAGPPGPHAVPPSSQILDMSQGHGHGLIEGGLVHGHGPQEVGSSGVMSINVPPSIPSWSMQQASDVPPPSSSGAGNADFASAHILPPPSNIHQSPVVPSTVSTASNLHGSSTDKYAAFRSFDSDIVESSASTGFEAPAVSMGSAVGAPDDDFGEFAAFSGSAAVSASPAASKSSHAEDAGFGVIAATSPIRRLSGQDSKAAKVADIDSKLSSVKALVMNNLLYTAKQTTNNSALLDFDGNNGLGGALPPSGSDVLPSASSAFDLGELSDISSSAKTSAPIVDWGGISSLNSSTNVESFAAFPDMSSTASSAVDVGWADFSSAPSLSNTGSALADLADISTASVFDHSSNVLSAPLSNVDLAGLSSGHERMGTVLRSDSSGSSGMQSKEKSPPPASIAASTIPVITPSIPVLAPVSKNQPTVGTTKGKVVATGGKDFWQSSGYKQQAPVGTGLSPLDMLPPPDTGDEGQSVADDWGDFSSVSDNSSAVSGMDDMDVFSRPVQPNPRVQVSGSAGVSWGKAGSTLMPEVKPAKATGGSSEMTAVPSWKKSSFVISDEEKSVASLDLKQCPMGGEEQETGSERGATVDDDSPSDTASQSSGALGIMTVNSEFVTLGDRYSGLIGEPQDVERHIYVWKQGLHECHNVLDEACRLVNGCTSAAVCREVFNISSSGQEYIAGVSEIYLVSRRIVAAIKATSTVDSRLSTLMDNLQQTWTALCELLTTIDIQVPEMRPVDEAGLPKQLSDTDSRMQQQQKACGVCLLDVASQTTTHQLSYAGRLYHAPCANFWVNCVDSMLPALVIPTLL